MGLFDFGKKQDAVSSIQLRTKTLEAVLKTKNLTVATARVVFVIDVSGSMTGDFQNGTVQSITERLMPLGLKFDDNGEMEVYRFSGKCESCKNVGIGNINGFVDQYVKKGAEWNGTEYAPIFERIFEDYVENNKSVIPTFVIVVTDGDNSDKQETIKAIKEISKYNIFFKFVGVGTASMAFLEKLDDMDGRTVDNANFVRIRDINKISDEDLYKNLLEEYDVWQAAAKSKGIL